MVQSTIFLDQELIRDRLCMTWVDNLSTSKYETASKVNKGVLVEAYWQWVATQVHLFDNIAIDGSGDLRIQQTQLTKSIEYSTSSTGAVSPAKAIELKHKTCMTVTYYRPQM